MASDEGRRSLPLGWIGLSVLLALLLAAAFPYWTCPPCEGSGQVHHFDGATITPSSYAALSGVIKPKVHRVETCPLCDGRGRCAGWRWFRERWR